MDSSIYCRVEYKNMEERVGKKMTCDFAARIIAVQLGSVGR
jgi:hypothetical protein